MKKLLLAGLLSVGVMFANECKKCNVVLDRLNRYVNFQQKNNYYDKVIFEYAHFALYRDLCRAYIELDNNDLKTLAQTIAHSYNKTSKLAKEAINIIENDCGEIL